MSSSKQWTGESIPDQTDRIAIVTGANSGIGYETARALAWRGATVIMACRSIDRGSAAAERIRVEPVRSAKILGGVDVLQLDLADLASVQRFAEVFRERHGWLDLLINNAGVMASPLRQETVDGFEIQFGTNHLGHFVLTGLVLDKLLRAPAARVVVVSSQAHRRGEIDFDDLQATRNYGGPRAYGQSKLANLLFAYELQRRFEAFGATAISAAAHPGWTATNLQEHYRFIQWLNPLLAQRPEQGALPSLYAATAPDVAGGDYYGPGGFMELWGTPQKVRSSARSHDSAAATRLWSVSEELTGVRYSNLDG